MKDIRDEIAELLPEPSFGEDIRSKMVPCTPPEVPVETKAAAKIEPVVEPPAPASVIEKPVKQAKAPAASGCFQMDAGLLIPRLKSRVEPQLPPGARAYVQNSQVTVRVKARIDEKGSVTVNEVAGSNVIINNSVRVAVEQWRFTPVRDESGPRCVDTELPIVFSGK